MNSHILAQLLLDAQVEHIRQGLISPAALPHMVRIMDDILGRAAHFKLGEVVSREAIQGVVRTYAFELNLGGGILELIGEMARQLYQVWQQHPPTPRELITDDSAAQWIDKIVELQPLRQEIIRQFRHSQLAKSLLSQLVIQTAQRQLPAWLAQQSQQHHRLSLRGKLIDKLIHSEQQLIEWLSQHIANTIQHSGAFELDNQTLTDFLQQLWSGIREIPLDQHAFGLTPLDVEELVVLAYEDWKHLRDTDYIRRLIMTGIDVFFEVYSDYTLTDLLDEVGITRQHMLGEIARFAPPVIQALEQSGDLYELIKLQLEGFYQDQKTLDLLRTALDAHDTNL
ncbi:MAG: hypothetical protein VXW65_07850 [Pseudomonadota bacterium]|nr:hypothetical protein [Pseudomonadota bacterium]